MQTQEIQYEEELLRNPYNIKVWLNYITFKQTIISQSNINYSSLYIIYERALKYLPRSYKLWHQYLMLRTKNLRNKSIYSKKHSILINTYERSLIYMNKMPRIWINYCKFLISIHKGTETRRSFDRALQALPITQHKELWSLYIVWIKKFSVPETAIRVYRRYLMYDSAYREDFVTYLESIGQYEEAARQLSICLNDSNFVSPSGQTEHQLWMHLCDICAKHPEKVVNTLKVEAIIRSGLSKFSDEVGRLWNSLADYYIRLGQFEKARDIYEEACNSVTTVRDFTIVFDAYVKIEESVLTTKIRFLQDTMEEECAEDPEEAADINMRLSRIEYLMEKRPLLLNSVVLRQNPHNVHEWHKRAKLYKDDKQKAILTYIEAVKTVDPKVAVGRLSGLWLALARQYEQDKDPENARVIYEKAVIVNYKSVEELANVWCAWGEMEMRLEEYERALTVMKQAVAEPTQTMSRRKAQIVAQGKGEDKFTDHFDGAVVADRLYKNVKVWNLYLDLEESLGTIESCRAAYDRVLDLKVITAQMALNYAAFLEEHNYYEDSFRVYERAVALFIFPQVKKIWLQYLDRFMERYGGSKLERLRDLFEQAITKVPSADAAEFYIKYAKAEEQFGLTRHAIAVYDRATRAVSENTRIDMYRLYIKKVEQFFGITKTRPIYERALQDLPDDDSKALCLEFAETERKLGEVDRARAVFQYGSQFADPRRDKNYWVKWRNFEESHGNENTFRDMLRVQRSVETAFSHVNYLAADLLGMVPATAKPSETSTKVVQSSAALVGIDALEKEAEQEALNMLKKRKHEVDNNNNEDDEQFKVTRTVKDDDEIDI